jgi:hypothetical protein
LPVKIGFLVGTRHYQSHVSQFRVGDVLRITANEELTANDGLVAMRCTIHAAAGTLRAEAALLVFQPDDLDAYLRQTPSAHIAHGMEGSTMGQAKRQRHNDLRRCVERYKRARRV